MACMLGKVFQNTEQIKIYEITLKIKHLFKAKHLISFIIQGLAILKSLYTLHDLTQLLLLLLFFFPSVSFFFFFGYRSWL